MANSITMSMESFESISSIQDLCVLDQENGHVHEILEHAEFELDIYPSDVGNSGQFPDYFQFFFGCGGDGEDYMAVIFDYTYDSSSEQIALLNPRILAHGGHLYPNPKGLSLGELLVEYLFRFYPEGWRDWDFDADPFVMETFAYSQFQKYYAEIGYNKEDEKHSYYCV
jgi:hypothetical protein